MKQAYVLLGAAVLASAAGACSDGAGEATAAQGEAQTPAQAGGVADPAAYVLGIYDQSKATADHELDESATFTPRLAALHKDGQGPEGELGRMEMNFWTNAQDDDIKRAAVKTFEVDRAPARRVVAARFDNIQTPTLIHTYWEKGANGRWYLDDAHNVPVAGVGSAPWTLSLVLKYGDYGSERVD